MNTRWFKESITCRLITITSLLFFVAFIILSLLLYHILLKNYRNSYRDFFNNEIMVLHEIISKPNSDTMQGLRQEIVLEPSISNYHYLIRVNTLGRPLIETPGLGQLIGDININDTTSPIKIKLNNRTYSLLATEIRANNQNYQLIMLLNITEDTKILKKVRLNLMIISLAFVPIFLLFGIFLVKIGLKPLNVFVRQIRKLTPNSLEPLELKKIPSELKQLLVEINNLITRTKDSHDALSSFSSNIAHELRTPINNLMISNDLFAMTHQKNPDITNQAASNIEEYQRLSKLIDKLLFLARLSTDKKHFTFETLNLNKEAAKTAEFHEALAEENQITIKTNASGFIHADKDLFHNALSNLLTNAIKYSPKNSCVSIATKTNQEQLIVSVVDEGPGIPASELKKISTRFYRFNKQKTPSSGLGLGLSIVSSIMAAMDAKLEIQLNSTKGLTANMIFKKHINILSPSIS